MNHPKQKVDIALAILLSNAWAPNRAHLFRTCERILQEFLDEGLEYHSVDRVVDRDRVGLENPSSNNENPNVGEHAE